MKNYFQNFLEVNKKNKFTVIFFLVLFSTFFIYKFYSILFTNPGVFLKIPIFIISIMFHEIAHGIAANYSGDSTAKIEGRLSLNPLKHIDPIGILLPLMLIFTGSNFVIGWAKPVPVNYSNINNGRLGEFLISVAGIVTNLLLAFLGALLIRVLPQHFTSNIFPYLAYFISINLLLAVFNLIPIPPLDGSKIIASLSNKDLRYWIFSLDKYGFFFILLLAWTGLLSKFIYPLYSFLIDLLDKFILL
ncbi:MAG: site-2 protease family protein [Fusobacteriaceae bacterium]